MSELLWRMLPGVRRGERDRFLFFFVLAALLNIAATLGLAGSEALFLSRLGADALPPAFIIASLATLVGSLLYAGVVGRARNDRLFIVLLTGTAIALLADLVVLRQGSSVVLFVLFATFYMSQAVFVSLHYWTFATDFFDTLSSKRLFPLFAVGASVGGMIGGALAVGVSRLFSGEALVLAWAAALTIAALQIRWARTRLMRWSPVGAEEADESSVEGLRGALRYLRRSRMATWLVVSVVGMVFALTLMQFLYLDIFASSFETAEQLATFFGLYLAITNGIEILVGNALTPWLIRRFGVAQANLAHPILTVLTFVGLALDPRLWVAVAARANRELLENALAGPVRALSYNALPLRFRGRMRALLEGVVFFAAMSIAGAVLLGLANDVPYAWLAAVGGAAAILYAVANLIVRREYLKSLVEELRQGRLDLGSVAGELGTRELSGLAELWQQTLTDEPERISNALLELAAPLAARGFAAIVAGQVEHPDARVRAATLVALVSAEVPEAEALVVSAVGDPDASVRLCALELAHALPEPGPALRESMRARLDDASFAVRAEAALSLGAEGEDTLAAMLCGEDAHGVVAALARVPRSLVATAQPCIDSAVPEIRASAIDCMTRLGADEQLPPTRLVEDLRDESAAVRRAAAAALARRNDISAIQALAQALDDVSRAVRVEAQHALASLGDAGVLAAAAHCRGARIWTVDAALGTVAQAGGRVAHALLRQCFADRVREAWTTKLAVARCADGDDLETRFLRAALDNAHERATHLAFRLLELLEDPAVVRSVVRELEGGDPRSRADALEVLSNLGEREVSHRLALLLEDDPLEEKLPALAGFVHPPPDEAQVLRDAADSADRWLRLAAARYGERRGSDGGAASGEDDAEERDIMERLLALRRVPLFTHLSLEQLEVVNQLLQEVEFLADEVIMREGDAGTELCILVEGEVTFYKAWRTPAEERGGVMQPVGYFGEIAILDNEPRSATAIASRDSRLLTLASGRFKELILQAPEIAFEIFPILTARIRAAESRVTALKAGT